MTIRLCYFEARARAQFLRAYFAVRGIEFEDERVPLDEGFASWQAMRGDRARTGPLQRLPVLHYGEELVPETFVIASYVHRRLGDADVLSDEQNRRHDVLLSCAYTDLMLPIAMVIWGDLAFVGIDLAKYAETSLNRIQRTLEVLEVTLGEWGWVDALEERPVTVADCLLWEELDQARLLFGDRLALDDKPLVAGFHADHPARASFEDVLAARPCQITGRPGEAEAIEAIQGMLGG